MKKDWTKNIHNRLSDYEREAPDGLFDDIVKEMNRRNITPMPYPKKTARVVPLWMRGAATAAAVLVAGFFLWHSFPYGDDADVNGMQGTSAPAAQKLAQENTPNDNATAADTENSTMTSDNSTLSNVVANIYNKVKANVTTSTDNTLLAKNDGDETMLCTEAGVEGTVENDTKTVKKNDTDNKPTYARIGGRPGTNTYTPRRTTAAVRTASNSHDDNGVSLGTYYSGGMSNSSGVGNGSMPGGRETFSDPVPGGAVLENLKYMPKSEDFLYSHNQPVKLGVSVNIPLTAKWSLQTGLTYSYLSSDIETDKIATIYGSSDGISVDDYNDYSAKQKLHYVGIPVSMAYNLWSNDAVRVYLSAGGEVEKLVKGNITPDAGYKGELNDALPHGKVKENELQFSVNAAAGIQYNATPNISMYAEPGVSYYPDNGSGVQNFYKDKKTNFNLNIGLRININK